MGLFAGGTLSKEKKCFIDLYVESGCSDLTNISIFLTVPLLNG